MQLFSQQTGRRLNVDINIKTVQLHVHAIAKMEPYKRHAWARVHAAQHVDDASLAQQC